MYVWFVSFCFCAALSRFHTLNTKFSQGRWSNFLRQVVNCLWSHPSTGMTLQKFYICPWWALPAWDLLKNTSLLYYLVENYWTNEQILSYYCKLQSGGAPIYILKGKVFIIQSLICAIFILPFTRFEIHFPLVV